MYVIVGIGNGNLKLEQHSRIISLFTVLNSFIRNRTTRKSNDLKELFGKVQHSSPYNKHGIHWFFTSSRITSDAILPIFIQNSIDHSVKGSSGMGG